MVAIRTTAGLALAVLALGNVQARAQEGEGGKVAYLRDGNVFVYDLASGHGSQLTRDGVTAGEQGFGYGPPVFVDGGTLAVVRWRWADDGATMDRQILLGGVDGGWKPVEGPRSPFDLGYDASTGKLVYTDELVGGEGPVPARALYVLRPGRPPELIEGFQREVLEGSPWSERIRVAPEGGLMLVPTYPDNPVDMRELLTLPGCRPLALLTEPRGSDYITDADFSLGAVYIAVLTYGPSPYEQGGLYEVLLDGGKPRLVMRGVRRAAVSGTLGIAVVEQPAGDEEGVLVTVPLEGGKPTSLRENGCWPDIWPR
jgi:hypothetical protein